MALEGVHTLIGRDAAADAAAAAMKAYQDGIASAIALIVLYLSLTLVVVGLVSFMGFLASPRVRRSPIFALLAICSLLCISACAVNISLNRDLVVHPNDGIDRSRYISVIILAFFIPFLCDFTLILRILAFFPRGSVPRWKPLAAVAFPSLIKIPRLVYIIMYINYCWHAATDAGSMLVIVNRVNQVQYAVVEWSLMLADQLYCTGFLLYKLYGLGWGWGDEKHVGNSILMTLRTIIYSALASFAIPSFFVVTLIVMQTTHFNPEIEGYIFSTLIPLSIGAAAFACLWPTILADRKKRRNEQHPSACASCHSCNNCTGDIEYEVSKGGVVMSQRKHNARKSLRKSPSVTTSGEDLLEAGHPPFLSYNQTNRARSGSTLSTRKLPPYLSSVTGNPSTVDEEAGIELRQHATSKEAPSDDEKARSSTGDHAVFVVEEADEAKQNEARSAGAKGGKAHRGSKEPGAFSRIGDNCDVGTISVESVSEDRNENGHGESSRSPRPESTEYGQWPMPPNAAQPRAARSGSVNQAQKMWQGRATRSKETDEGDDFGTRSAPGGCHHTSHSGFTGTLRNAGKLVEKGRNANPVDLGGILIVTTEEQWTSK
ncbi:hypothetical protein ACQY0O_003549 [Thecaphora frezii]